MDNDQLERLLERAVEKANDDCVFVYGDMSIERAAGKYAVAVVISEGDIVQGDDAPTKLEALRGLRTKLRERFVLRQKLLAEAIAMLDTGGENG